jgi:hypothetical protein
VGPTASLNAVEERKIFHCQKSNEGRSARSPSLYPLSYPDSLKLIGKLTNSMELSIPERSLVVRTLDVSQHFMEPEGSIPNSQKLSTCPYPEPDQSSPHYPITPL